MIDTILHHLTSEHDEPVLPFSLDCTGFHLAHRRVGFLAFGQLHLDGADFGETYPVILRQRKARLWIGEALIAPIALKSWVSWCFALFDAPKEGLVCFIDSPQDILQDLRMNILVLWPDRFDFREMCRLPVIRDGVFLYEKFARRFIIVVGVPLHHHFIGISTLLESSIVKLSCPIQGPLELLFLLFIRVQSVLVGFQARHAFDSRYTV